MPIAQHKDGALLFFFFFFKQGIGKKFLQSTKYTQQESDSLFRFCYFATIIQQSIKLYDNKKCLINTVSKYGLKRFARKSKF